MTIGKKKKTNITREMQRAGEMRSHYEAGFQAGYEAGYLAARSLFERHARKSQKEKS